MFRSRTLAFCVLFLALFIAGYSVIVRPDAVSAASERVLECPVTNMSQRDIKEIYVYIPGKDKDAVELLQGKPLIVGEQRKFRIRYNVPSPYNIYVVDVKEKSHYVERILFAYVKSFDILKGPKIKINEYNQYGE